MGRRLAPLIMIALLVVLHAQLWFGRGSVPNVAKLSRELSEQTQRNTQAALANDRVYAEIHDLKEGLEIVEEKARTDLGMLKANEIFVQIAR
jgi:cell division protein FtsB